MTPLRKIILSFVIAHVGLALAIYSLFKKSEPIFIFGALVDYVFRLYFIWLLSLPPGAETGEERGVRLFSFGIATIVLGIVTLTIGFLLVRFYFR